MNILNVKFLEIENRNLAVLDGDYFTIVLEKEQSYEKHFTAFANLVINEGDIAIDFGANLGYHTITLSSFGSSRGASKPWGLWTTFDPLQSFSFLGLFCIQPTARSL